MSKNAPLVAIIFIAILVMLADVLPTIVLAVIAFICIVVVFVASVIDWTAKKHQPVIELQQRSIGIQVDGQLITEVQPVTYRGVKGWAVHGDIEEGFYPDSEVSIWLELE